MSNIKCHTFYGPLCISSSLIKQCSLQRHHTFDVRWSSVGCHGSTHPGVTWCSQSTAVTLATESDTYDYHCLFDFRATIWFRTDNQIDRDTRDMIECRWESLLTESCSCPTCCGNSACNILISNGTIDPAQCTAHIQYATYARKLELSLSHDVKIMTNQRIRP